MNSTDAALIHEARLYTRHLEQYRSLDATTIGSNMTIRNDILFCVVMLSEILKDMSPASRGLAPDIPTSAIRGMRNRIIHRRHDVKLNVITEVVRCRAHQLTQSLDRLAHRLQSTDA